MSSAADIYTRLAATAIEDAMDSYDMKAEQQMDELCNVLKARRSEYLNIMRQDVAACRARIAKAERDGTDILAAARLGMSTRTAGSG
jgi:hypothetical protein